MHGVFSKILIIFFLLESLYDIGDGSVRIWKDYSLKGKQRLVTAFSSVQGHRPGVRSVNAVVDWQQQSGYMVHALPNINHIYALNNIYIYIYYAFGYIVLILSC